MKSPRIFVPNDATAVACGAERVAHKLEHELLARGVWVRPFGDIVYLTPALTIDAADLDRLIEAVAGVVTELAPGST